MSRHISIQPVVFAIGVVLLALVALCPFGSYATAGAMEAGFDATWLKKERGVIIHSDGRIDEQVRWVKRLDTLQAVGSMGDPRLTYHRDHQELILLTARTTTADGRVHDAPPYALNSSTPDAQVACPRMSSETETVVTLVGLELGATVELAYEIRDRRVWRSHAEGIFRFAESGPVKEAVFSLQVPGRMSATLRGERRDSSAGSPALHAALQAGENVHFDRVDARHATTYRWKAGDLEPIGSGVPFPVAPPPVLYYSTAKDWGSAISSILPVEAYDLSSSPSWSELEAQLLPGGLPASGDLPSLHVLLGGLGDAFRYCQGELARPGTAAGALETVVASRQATALESAALLKAGLNKLGFEAQVLLSTRPLPQLRATATPDSSRAIAEPPPVLALLADVFVRVRLGSSSVFIDPHTSKLSAGPDYEWLRWIAVPARGGGFTLAKGTEVFKRRGPAKVAVTASIDIAGGKVATTLTMHSGGRASLWYAYPTGFDKPAKADGLAAPLFPGSTAESVSVGFSSPESFVVTVLGTAQTGPLSCSMALPVGALSSELEAYVLPWLREKAHLFPLEEGIQFHLSISVGSDSGTLVSGLRSKETKASGASYKVVVIQKSRRLTITRDLQVRPAPHRGSDLKGLRDVLSSFVADNRQIISLVPMEIPELYGAPGASKGK